VCPGDLPRHLHPTVYEGDCQGWDAVEAKTEAMDAFVNVGTDMAEFIRLHQLWHVNDDAVSTCCST
jgi:hypothetical protein